MRTRSIEKYMKDERFLKLLREMVVFYCVSNHVNYQQGLLEVAVPFVLIKSSRCKPRLCYGYFCTFMNRYLSLPNL